MNFATKLRAMRALRDMSQQELAEVLEIDRRQISMLESGVMLPSPQLERQIRGALHWPEEAERAFEILAESQP